jgi:hypothetical protein
MSNDVQTFVINGIPFTTQTDEGGLSQSPFNYHPLMDTPKKTEDGQKMAQKTQVDTIEKLIYKLEMNLNQPHKYTPEERDMMHRGIEWLRHKKLQGYTFDEILDEFKVFPLRK